MPGTLFVVATPIGNLEDLTFRALRILREVQLVAAEDTRRTARLLAHYDIRVSTVSLREHNEHRETPRLIARLERGESIALVSDAGTPGIADPGARLVRAARERRLPVVPIPGPSAIAAALSVSGLPADQFVFAGFPPPTGAARQEWMATVSGEERTVVLFEAPHRVRRTVAELQRNLVLRPIVCFREITKINEEYVECHKQPGSIGLSERGEYTIIIGPQLDQDSSGEDDGLAIGLYDWLCSDGGVDADRAVVMAGKATGVKPSHLRKKLKLRRYSVKQQS